MMEKRVDMYYDKELDRWVVESGDQAYGLRCGEGLHLHLGQRTLHGTLELGRSWYIIVDGVPLGLLEGRQYMVSIKV
jgi:hypothetical protein